MMRNRKVGHGTPLASPPGPLATKLRDSHGTASHLHCDWDNRAGRLRVFGQGGEVAEGRRAAGSDSRATVTVTCSLWPGPGRGRTGGAGPGPPVSREWSPGPAGPGRGSHGHHLVYN